MISVWNFVLWNDFSLKFSLKFCALKWIQFEIQSEIFCSEMNSALNFVHWNDFSLKFYALKWIQSEFCALKWIQSELLCFEMNSVWNFLLWNEFSLKFCALNFFALNWNFLSLSAIVCNRSTKKLYVISQ